MSLPKIIEFNIWDLKGKIYDFAKVGDTLAEHNHTEEDSHTIYVGPGPVLLQIRQPDGSIFEERLETGAFRDTHPGFPHAIVSLGDNTRTVHHQKKLTNKTNHVSVASSYPKQGEYKMKLVTYTEEEIKAQIQLLDMAIKTGGYAVAEAGVVLIKKLQAALAATENKLDQPAKPIAD